MGRLIDVDDVIAAIAKLQQVATIPRSHKNDLVFRRDAIEAIIRETNQDGAYGYGDTKSLVNVLDALPSAQSERPKGYIKIEVISMLDGEDLVCENCGEYCLSPSYKFCPKCGIEFIGVRGEQK